MMERGVVDDGIGSPACRSRRRERSATADGKFHLADPPWKTTTETCQRMSCRVRVASAYQCLAFSISERRGFRSDGQRFQTSCFVFLQSSSERNAAALERNAIH